jgi:TetR/AcrR family transcriptional regulator
MTNMIRHQPASGKQHNRHASDEDTASTAERIVAATLKLLATRCFHSISIRDIASAAHVNSALISYHFKNKENLYSTVVSLQFTAYQQQVIPAFTTEGDIRETLRTICHVIASFHRSNPCWLILYLRELSNPSPIYQSIIQPCIKEASDKCVEMINAAIHAGVVASSTNPRHVALALVGMVNYFFITSPIMHDLELEPIHNINAYLDFVSETLIKAVSQCS